MIKTILGIAILSAALAASPASARAISCAGDSMTKIQDAKEAMADGPGKTAVTIEIAKANEAYSNGDTRGCAAHISSAEHLEKTSSGL